MPFSDKLIQLRTQRRISQEELAAELGVSRQTVGKWENGQASPEMSGLIALSSYFSVSIDALVKENACQLAPAPSTSDTELRSFLLDAKRATYAGHAHETSPSRPDSHDYIYTKGDLSYRDSYFGGTIFHGEETVWSSSRAVWCMNYSGRTLSDNFSGDFLKLALRNGTSEMPYRGPQVFQRGGYTYVCHSRGMLDWFSGDEAIYYEDQAIYECRFHGGFVK